jgi:hypothetical protein
VEITSEELVSVIANRLLTQSQHLRDFTDALTLSPNQESMEAFDPFQRAAGVGLLETAIEVLAGGCTTLSLILNAS